MIQLKIRSPLQPIASDIDEVHIFRHDFRQLMPIVLRPCRRERLRDIMNRSFIRLVLGLNDPALHHKNCDQQVAQ